MAERQLIPTLEGVYIHQPVAQDQRAQTVCVVASLGTTGHMQAIHMGGHNRGGIAAGDQWRLLGTVNWYDADHPSIQSGGAHLGCTTMKDSPPPAG